MRLKKLVTLTTLSLALTTTLLAGCDKSETEATEQTSAKAENGSGYATAEVFSIPLFYSVSQTMAVADPTIASNPDIAKCVKEIDHTVSIPAYQEYLKKHLTEEELTQIDEFYSTELGQKQKQSMIAQIDAIAAGTGEEQVAQIEPMTDEENTKIQAFMDTPAGKKLPELLAGDTYFNDGFPNYTLVELEKEFNKCDMELPSKEEMAQWFQQNR